MKIFIIIIMGSLFDFLYYYLLTKKKTREKEGREVDLDFCCRENTLALGRGTV